MNLHEYQAKDLLRKYNLPLLEGKSYLENVDDLKKVDMPVAICIAQSDTLHEDCSYLSDALIKGTLVKVPNSQYAHDVDIVKDVVSWEDSSC